MDFTWLVEVLTILEASQKMTHRIAATILMNIIDSLTKKGVTSDVTNTVLTGKEIVREKEIEIVKIRKIVRRKRKFA